MVTHEALQYLHTSLTFLLLQRAWLFSTLCHAIATAAMLPGELEDVICLLSVCVAHLLLDPQSKTLFQAKFVKKNHRAGLKSQALSRPCFDIYLISKLCKGANEQVKPRFTTTSRATTSKNNVRKSLNN